jgi:hypothetical protein
MSSIDYFVVMTRLQERGAWRRLARLLSQPHPVLPGEREAFCELVLARPTLVRGNRLRLDATGFRVVQV